MSARPSLAMKASYQDETQRLELESGMYTLRGEALRFFKDMTGIEDEEALKTHILAVQAKAYKVHGFPCIRLFTFLELKIMKLSGYKQALKLLQERQDPIYLDIGCCFGTDIRKVVADGWPVQNVVASDLRRCFWDYGHDLAKTTPETFPAAFVEGDAFDTNMIAPRHAFLNLDEIDGQPMPDLHSLTSLTPLQGKVSAIYAAKLFHLFSEEEQLELARRLASLLFPAKGSVIFGNHVGHDKMGLHVYYEDAISRSYETFCHSPESWEKMWIEEVFWYDVKDGEKKPRVSVEAELVRYENPDFTDENGEKELWMHWSVTRL